MAANEVATHHRGAGALPYRRGSRDTRRPCLAGTATPNDRRSLAFSSLTRPWVPGFQVKDAAWRVRQGNRSRRRVLQEEISSIFADDAPHGRLRDEDKSFYLRFPSSRRGLRSFTPSLSHTHRKWGIIGSRGTAADRGRQGGLPYGILRGHRGGTSTSTGCLAQGSV